MRLRDRLEIEASETRAKLNKLAETDELTDEQRTEMRTLSAKLDDVESRRQASIKADPLPEWQPATTPTQPDSQLTELRSRARVGRYLACALTGRAIDGAEAEYQSETGATGIPLSLLEAPSTSTATETRADAVTPTPSTVGISQQPIVPFVFSHSVAPRLAITMPRAPSGSYAYPRLTTSLTAGAQAKGAARQSSAGGFTSVSTTPKRISARLSIAQEDIHAFGRDDFESALRQNLALALSDQLDDAILTGTGTAPAIRGLIPQVTAPTAATNTVTFASFAATVSGLIDGIFALTERDVLMVTNTDTYSKLAATFASSDDSVSITDRAMRTMNALFAHGRMPASVSNVANALVCRKAMPAGDNGMRAVCPIWSDLSITDPYTDSGAAVSHFTMHILLGDVLVLQPASYAQVSIKSA